jgi:hypothetical protein
MTVHTGVWKNPVHERCGRQVESPRRRSGRCRRARRRAARGLRLPDPVLPLLAGATPTRPPLSTDNSARTSRSIACLTTASISAIATDRQRPVRGHPAQGGLHATCRCAERAGPASATIARAVLSLERSLTTLSRSTCRRPAIFSSTVRIRPATSSTSDGQIGSLSGSSAERDANRLATSG